MTSWRLLHSGQPNRRRFALLTMGGVAWAVWLYVRMSYNSSVDAMAESLMEKEAELKRWEEQLKKKENQLYADALQSHRGTVLPSSNKGGDGTGLNTNNVAGAGNTALPNPHSMGVHEWATATTSDSSSIDDSEHDENTRPTFVAPVTADILPQLLGGMDDSSTDNSNAADAQSWPSDHHGPTHTGTTGIDSGKGNPSAGTATNTNTAAQSASSPGNTAPTSSPSSSHSSATTTSSTSKVPSGVMLNSWRNATYDWGRAPWSKGLFDEEPRYDSFCPSASQDVLAIRRSPTPQSTCQAMNPPISIMDEREGVLLINCSSLTATEETLFGYGAAAAAHIPARELQTASVFIGKSRQPQYNFRIYGDRDWTTTKSDGREVSQVVIDDDAEFVVVQCAENNVHAHVVNAFDPTLYEQRQKLFPPDKKPLSVVVIAFNDMSRQEFMREMPRTAMAMERAEMELKQFRTHQYFRYGLSSSSPLAQLGTILTGQSWHEDFQPDRDIWDIARKHGYVTSFSSNECPDRNDTAASFVKRGRIDHNFVDIGCIVDGKGRNEGCIGDKSVASHVFEYNLQFLKKYNGVGRLSVIHLANHNYAAVDSQDNTNSTDNNNNNNNNNKFVVDPSIDASTASFLSSVTTTHKDTVVLVTSLQGAPLEDSTIRAQAESWQPLLSILAPATLANDPSAGVNMNDNENVVLGGGDIHQTIIHLLHYPDKGQRPDYSTPKMPALSQKDGSCWSVGAEDCRAYFLSILSYEADNRTCAEAGVPSYACTCAFPWKRDASGGTTPSTLRGGGGGGGGEATMLDGELFDVADSIVQQINALVSSDVPPFRGANCRQLTLTRVIETRVSLPGQNMDRIPDLRSIYFETTLKDRGDSDVTTPTHRLQHWIAHLEPLGTVASVTASDTPTPTEEHELGTDTTTTSKTSDGATAAATTTEATHGSIWVSDLDAVSRVGTETRPHLGHLCVYV